MSQVFKSNTLWYSDLYQNVVIELMQENLICEIPQARNEEVTVRSVVGSTQIVAILLGFIREPRLCPFQPRVFLDWKRRAG